MLNADPTKVNRGETCTCIVLGVTASKHPSYTCTAPHESPPRFELTVYLCELGAHHWGGCFDPFTDVRHTVHRTPGYSVAITLQVSFLAAARRPPPPPPPRGCVGQCSCQEAWSAPDGHPWCRQPLR